MVVWITDTHCHLNLDIFQDELAEIIERAQNRGVRRILVPGIDLETSRKAVDLAERFPDLYAAVGVHPSDAGSWNEDTESLLRELAAHPKVVAIGEIGLDYYRDHAPRSLQRNVFRAQLELAAELELPVIIHNRNSFDDLWMDLSEWQEQLARRNLTLASRPGVLHSFDGTLATARQVIEQGFYIGISGPVTFKNARERQNVVAGLPLEHLLIETDSPYLTPQPYRGKWPNEPANVAFIAEKIAELHDHAPENVIRITWENAATLFNWE